jgi:Tfp pilus assembly protein PilF
MPSASHGTSVPRKAFRARLDSWKEIADYLSKGERTAKRWESERSLPVHHVPGHGHGSVYAFTAELDEWLLSTRPREPNSPHEPATGAHGARVFPISLASANNTPDPPKTSSSRKHPLLWRVAPYFLVTIVVALLAAPLANPHSTQAYTSFLRSLWASTRSTSQSPAADPEKLLAHDLYLRGRFEWNKRSPESLNRALDYFTQAVVHDPGNAQAYVGLADTYNLLREYTLMPESEAYERATAAARKAIELDDSLAEAHRSLAFDEVWGNWDFAAGEREFQRAIELNPRDPVAHLWFANAFSAPGWYPVCLREIDRAQELDPSSRAILADKGLLLFHAGKAKLGLDLVRQVELSDPDFLSPHRYLASMYLSLRNYPEYLAESEKAADLSNDQVLKHTTLAAKAGLQQDGERGFFRALYNSQKKVYGEGKLAGTFLAMTCARMGKKQEAIQLLREEYDKHSPHFLMMRDHPDLLLLKDEPGYRELLSKIHAPQPGTSADEPRASAPPRTKQ